MADTNNINFTMAEYSLKEWGLWFQKENQVQDIGYPKMAAFVKTYYGTGSFGSSFDEFFEASETVKLVHRALIGQPIFYQIAQASFAYCRDKSFNQKSIWIHTNKGLYLGSTPKSMQIKYKLIESQMMAYVQGYLIASDEPIPETHTA